MMLGDGWLVCSLYNYFLMLVAAFALFLDALSTG